MTDNQIAVKVDHVSKYFKLPTEATNSLRTALVNRFKGIKGYKEQHVLKDISFEVEKGDFFGILGRNGSGKSTLLKIISEIYVPEKGTVTIDGKLVSFNELGVGFNPELTGRENVYMNGAMLGFSTAEIDAMYDDIVDFAELHDFMNQKLKNYSAGMQVRLAFSVAIKAQGDILILDEVLAVGDDAFQRKLNAGQKVIAVELDSPKDADLTAYLEGARRLQAAGADLLTIADCPIARARMDSSLVACRVHRELGMNVLPHMTCRDRNLHATKALLLGLYAEGVREVLAITGDPIPTAERDDVKNVYQFNSRKLAQYIVSLAGEGREMPSPITVFGALNLNARNFEVELRRAAEKLENGMSGFLTQPVLSAQAVENLKKTRETLGERAKILAGILPVVSQRNAIFMENEVNGIHVDDAIIQRFEGLDRAAGEELGLEVSVQAAKAAAPYVDGFYLMTPFNRVALMERLIARLRTEVTG